MFQFATCEPPRAKDFLGELYPSTELTEEMLREIMPLIEADVIRVQDPTFHWPAEIVPGNNWDEDNRDEVYAVCLRFHEAATAQSIETRKDRVK